MELSSNSELLQYATPHASIEPNDCDSFLNEFEVIGRDDDVASAMNNLALSSSQTAPAAQASNRSRTSDPANINSSSFGSQDDESQINSADMDNMLKNLVDENTKLKGALDELKETLTKKNDQFMKLVDDVQKAHDEDKGKHEQNINKIKQLETEKLALQQEIDSVKSKVEALEKELDEKDSNFTELVSWETQMKEKDEEIRLRDKNLEDLTTHLEHEKAQNIELKNFIRSANIDEMKTEVANYQARIRELNTVQIERDEQIEILRAQLESLQITIAKRESALNEKDEAYTPLKEALDAKQAEINQLYQQLSEKNSRYSNVAQELEEKNNDFSSLCQMLTEKHQQLDELVRAKDLAEEKCRIYHERCTLLEEEIENSKRVLTDFDKENSLLKTRVAALTTENESIENWKFQCELYQSDYNNVVQMKNLLNDRILELTREMDELREKNEKQQQELEQLHSTHIRFAQEHINRNENNSRELPTQQNKGNQTQDEKDDDDIISNVFNQLKRGVNSLLWDGDRPNEQESGASIDGAVGGEVARANIPREEDSRQNSENASAGSSPELTPCPICQKVFFSYANLQEHSWNCGRSTVSASHLDPFVFVPHQ